PAKFWCSHETDGATLFRRGTHHAHVSRCRLRACGRGANAQGSDGFEKISRRSDRLYPFSPLDARRNSVVPATLQVLGMPRSTATTSPTSCGRMRPPSKSTWP